MTLKIKGEQKSKMYLRFPYGIRHYPNYKRELSGLYLMRYAKTIRPQYK